MISTSTRIILMALRPRFVRVASVVTWRHYWSDGNDTLDFKQKKDHPLRNGLFFIVPFFPVGESGRYSHFDFNLNAAWQFKFHQGVNSFRVRAVDVQQAFVRTQLELLARFFVNVR